MKKSKVVLSVALMCSLALIATGCQNEKKLEKNEVNTTEKEKDIQEAETKNRNFYQEEPIQEPMEEMEGEFGHGIGIHENMVMKPVIYLYPEKTTDIDVKLDYNGDFVFTYPLYKDGWSVTASPDGTVIDKETGNEYSYLFWEGKDEVEYDMSKGFVVKGEDTLEFLRAKLKYLGLTPREYNEFMVFWTPLMQDNPYNLIAFQEEVYTDNAKLNITPEPDSILRVFMAYTPLNEPVEIEEQKLKKFNRKGFSVIEWGGAEVK